MMDGVRKGKRCWIIEKIMGVDIFLSSLMMTNSLVQRTKVVTKYIGTIIRIRMYFRSNNVTPADDQFGNGGGII